MTATSEPFEDLPETSFAEQIAAIREQFASEWENLAERHGKEAFPDEEARWADDARTGKKIPKDAMARNIIVHACKERRLSEEQIAQVLQEIME